MSDERRLHCPPLCVTTQRGSVCALPKVAMSLSGNKVLMTLSNTPLLKLEPRIQLGLRPALPQQLPAPLWLPHSSIITQFFFLRSTHPAGYRGSAAAKTMQLTHLNDSDFLCHHPPIHFLQDPIAELPERCRTFLTLSISYVTHHWILHLIFCKNMSAMHFICVYLHSDTFLNIAKLILRCTNIKLLANTHWLTTNKWQILKWYIMTSKQCYFCIIYKYYIILY